MSFSFRLLRAVRRHKSCWTMFNDHYSWTATRNADIVWVCMSAINRLFHKTPDNNRRLVQLFLIFLWIVGVRLCITLHFLQSDIIFGTIKACSEKALNRSCSKKTYCVADRGKRHIVKIIYVNGTQVFLCDAMLWYNESVICFFNFKDVGYYV